MNLHLLLIVIYFLSIPYMNLPLLPIVIYLFLIKPTREFISTANCNLKAISLKSKYNCSISSNCSLFTIHITVAYLSFSDDVAVSKQSKINHIARCASL